MNNFIQNKTKKIRTIRNYKRGRIGHSLTFLVMKRHELPLEEKIQLIKDNNGGLGMSVRKLAEKYSISKSSATNILSRREEYETDYFKRD